MASTKDHPDYEARKLRETERQRTMSAAGRDIGPLPKVVDADRKLAASTSLRTFCEVYFPRRFRLAWSPAHLRTLEVLEACVRDGGLFAIAMPRGSGKTTLAEIAALWGVAYGYRRFVVLVGATQSHADGILDSIKAEVEANDTLADDFPEMCHPVRRLEGINNRASGQTLDGVRTQIEWTGGQIVFPTVPGSKSSGSVIRSVGITGAIRGMKVAGPDGQQMRPDCVIIDDPQTKESSKSVSQTQDRESTIVGDILGLAGPDSTIAAVMPCTVIYPGDLADRFLDRMERPEWQGERFKMLESMPENLKLWDEYAGIRSEALRAGKDATAANEFYIANRAAMDAGAKAGWDARFKANEISAIQSAMNLYLRNPREFMAEYQNSPQAERANAGRRELDTDTVAGRLSGVPRGQVPGECTRLTAMIDVGGKVLWYAVMAWDEKFGGSVVDCGPFPDQKRAYFNANDASPTLADTFKGANDDEQIRKGLEALTSRLLSRQYTRHGSGEPVRIELCAVDSGWKADVVRKFCRESPHAAVLVASKGWAASGTAKPMDEWRAEPGVRTNAVGTPAWRLGRAAGFGRQLLFDADAWKSFIADRLSSAPSAAGAVMLFGSKHHEHQMLADHLTAEFSTQVNARGRTWDQWKVRPGRDNHLLDCVVGAAVAASVAGLRWSAGSTDAGDKPSGPTSARRKLSDIQREKREKQAKGA